MSDQLESVAPPIVPEGPTAPSRDGMTIIEVMIAMVVLGVGLLGLAGISLTVGKQYGSAARQANAAMIVQSRLDSLSSIACQSLAPTGPQSGATTINGVTERWNVTDGNDIKTIIDSVSFKGRVRPLVYTIILPCRD